MIEELRNVPVRKLIRALERDGFVFRRLKGSQRLSIGIPMAGESSSTTTMPETRYPLALSGKSSQPPTGMRKLSGGSA